ncbi:MAG TPA: sulfur carrier protein ThiS adenylyltransferase ThiF [Candidatus Omnitrophota bacterium]|nr:sulfur carrier protein ThiS adenylyltransferase ThiF [Candidatus Omnitrophota bacterium]
MTEENRLKDKDSLDRQLERKFGTEYMKKVRGVLVGIAGAGGLGSNCAANLVRSGFRRFVVADFDTVEHSNLDRQFYFYDQVGRKKADALKENLKRIDPDVEIVIFGEKVTGENAGKVFSECDVIVEAFDKAEEKRMLAEIFMKSGKFMVSASGISGIGHSDGIRTRKINDNFVIVGDLMSDISESPAVSPRVNAAAAKQADVVLEHVVGRSLRKDPSTGGGR